jgi:putative membrane protein
MVITLIRGAPSTLLGVPALLAVGARADLWLVLGGTAAAFLVAAAARWIAWSRFTYALTADAIVIESGVFSRNRRTIPYERVADVGIECRPLQRLFGLAKVTLETGGGGADDGALDSVSAAEAERLRRSLRRGRASTEPDAVLAGDTEPSASSPADGVSVFFMDTRRVLLWGLFNFSLVWIAVGFGAFQYIDESLGVDSSMLWDAVIARTAVVRSMPLIILAGVAALVVAVLLAIGMIAGLIRTTLRDYGYRLIHEGGRLRRTRGLFTRSEAIISLPRVQLVAIDDGVFRRRLGWSRLRAQVLGGDGAEGRQDLAPFARIDEVDRVLQALRLRRSLPSELEAVAQGHVSRALLRRVGPLALLILASALATPLALLATPLLVPVIGAALLGRRYHRYRLASGLLQVQRGVLNRTTWIAPLSRVQVVSLRRSWLQRRLGLATVLVDTAGGARSHGPDIHDVRENHGWKLLALLCRDGRTRDRT